VTKKKHWTTRHEFLCFPVLANTGPQDMDFFKKEALQFFDPIHNFF